MWVAGVGANWQLGRANCAPEAIVNSAHCCLQREKVSLFCVFCFTLALHKAHLK